MDRYNFKIVESKWQSKWEKEKSFSVKADNNKKILLLRNVPLPFG